LPPTVLYNLSYLQLGYNYNYNYDVNRLFNRGTLNSCGVHGSLRETRSMYKEL